MKGVIQPTKEKIERSNPRNLWSGNYYFPPTIKWLNLSSSQKIPFGQWIDLTTALTRNQNSLEQNFVDKYGSCFLGMISHEHFFLQCARPSEQFFTSISDKQSPREVKRCTPKYTAPIGAYIVDSRFALQNTSLLLLYKGEGWSCAKAL